MREPGKKVNDRDGVAAAKFRISGNRFYYFVQWRNTGRPTAFHIHRGKAGVNGPVVIDLLSKGTIRGNTSFGSVAVKSSLLRDIKKNPKNWYANMHTAQFPDGAVRGQLHPSRHLDLDLPHQLGARLDGANEVPPADPDGRGLALVRTGRERVCFAVGWTRIGAPIFAHIHAGAAGVNGPVVVLFFDVPELAATPPPPPAALPDTVSAVAGCVDDQDPATLRAIRRHPADFYVNVHNSEFPGGAIRGQLRRLA